MRFLSTDAPGDDAPAGIDVNFPTAGWTGNFPLQLTGRFYSTAIHSNDFMSGRKPRRAANVRELSSETTTPRDNGSSPSSSL